MAWLYHIYAAWQRKSFRLGHAIDTGQLGAQQLAASCRFAPWQFSTGAARYAPELLFDISFGSRVPDKHVSGWKAGGTCTSRFLGSQPEACTDARLVSQLGTADHPLFAGPKSRPPAPSRTASNEKAAHERHCLTRKSEQLQSVVPKDIFDLGIIQVQSGGRQFESP